MSILKKMKRTIKVWCSKVILRDKYSKDEEFNEQAEKEMLCILHGHKWKSAFNPAKDMKSGTKSRMYCENCGQVFHNHTYHK